MTASSNWRVLKFGGTSVANAKNWQLIRNILLEKNPDESILIVHSALSGVSNKLHQLIETKDSTLVDQIIAQHYSLCKDLKLAENGLDNTVGHLKSLFQRLESESQTSVYLEAEIMAQGELLSTQISAQWLNQQGIETHWLDARQWLRTDENDQRNLHSQVLSARCHYEADPHLQNQLNEVGKICLTQGFIAGDQHGRTLLLGRGGSDTSASCFGALLQAKCVEIWTDVPGMFTANPRMISTARQLLELEYDEAQEIATSGGKVLHPRCIQPVADAGIPLYVYALNRRKAGGTQVGGANKPHSAQVKAISVRKGLILVSMDSVRMWHQSGFLSDAFAVFKSQGLSVDLISTSQTNVTVSLDSAENILSPADIDGLKQELSSLCHLELIENCGAVTLVGQRMRATLHKLGPAMQVFAEHRIHMLNQSSNDLNLTVVVDEDQTERLAINLHRLLIGIERAEGVLGPTWEELMHDSLSVHAPSQAPWWETEAERLLDFSQDKTPCYVYDETSIRNMVSNLTQLNQVDRIFYAMKANGFGPVLETVESTGIGFECVSPQEIQYILDRFPDIDRDRLIFTPNFASRAEYQFAFDLGLKVTLDNVYPLQAWPEVFRGQNIFLRIDPGHGKGHHKYVRTAGEGSKFGIAGEEIQTLKNLVKQHSVTVKALHSHSGSGILNYENWQQTAQILSQLLDVFPEVDILNLGGGLGIQESPGEPALNMSALDDSLLSIRKTYPHLQLWLEPGRYIVANSGVLLTQVTQTKRKGSTHYVGVETGMNSLIRPALYGAYHPIVNLSKIQSPHEYTATVVGPICESGDILGVDRQLPICEEGDKILVANTGAYGAVMASRYNMRNPAEEYLLEAKK